MKKKVYLITLINLLNFNLYHHSITISTTKLAKILGMSQQNISKHLIEIEKLGLIKREITKNGQVLTLTNKGKEELKEIYYTLKKSIEKEKEIIIKGKIFTGIGEGGYYVTRKYYMNQFIQKIGFKPFPGTLNIKLVEPKDKNYIEANPHIFIPGTRTKYRTYGWVKCFPALIKDKYECCIITLERTHYNSSVVEIISPYNLRKKLNLKDNDIIEVKLIPIKNVQNKFNAKRNLHSRKGFR